jgi:hypothetical protein
MLDNSKINNLIKNSLAGLSTRQKEILEGRYGLNNPETLTLAELGDKYSLTRERVRQIEALALKAVRSKTNGPDFADFAKTVNNVLKNSGGTKREDFLIDELGGASQENKIKFLLEVCGQFKYSKDSKDFYPYWYASDVDQKRAASFVNYLLKNADRENFSASFAAAAKNSGINDNVARNYASLSKRVAINIYGDLGLSEWQEINPKTARDWAYLVLKKENRPLHFTEIAQMVSDVRKKKAHAPTIHNELIKDDKFVLVGKGTYTLKEFGVIPGTAREIISHFLKKHGPMKAPEVVKLVLKERLFKENTVLINLQNRKNFKRLDDGRYTTLV